MPISRSLVVETNNLAKGDPARTVTSLKELLVHLGSQTLPLASLAELVVTHDGLRAEDRALLEHAAGRAVTFVQVSEGAGYYDAKNRGFEATTGAVVAFGDADCWPDPAWLEHLFAPFACGADVQVVAGRTCYREGLLGTAATTIDFMYFPSPLAAGATRNFYANNVAFRRATFEQARYASEDRSFYRGSCQVLGLTLQRQGVTVVFEARARTTHRFPDSAADFVRLRLLRGADTVALTPYLARAYLPARLRPLARAPGLEAAVLASRLVFSLRAINAQEMPEVHGARLVACAGLVAALSILDGAGAAMKRLGLEHLLGDDAPSVVALGYHDDVDGLRPSPAPARAAISADPSSCPSPSRRAAERAPAV